MNYRSLTHLLTLSLMGCATAIPLDVVIPESYAGPHAGQSVEVALIDADDMVVDTEAGAIVEAGQTIFTLDGYVDGSDVKVAILIDSNFDDGTSGACEGEPDFKDHQWLYDATVSEGRFAVPEHNTSWTEVCDYFGG